jgi:membrane protein required for colicin V production
MWLDVLALLVLGLFAGMGALRGGLASALSLLSLGVSYAAALWAAPRFGERAAELTGAPALLGMPIAGTLAFAAAFLAMGLLSFALKRLERREDPRSPRDRFVGGVFGAARGVLVVFLLAYLALWVDALRSTGTVEALPELGDSTAAALTGSVVEAGVQAALDDGQAGRVVARMAGRPGLAFAELQSVLEHPAVAELQRDPAFWTYVEHGSVDAAMNRRSFLAISQDARLRGRLAELGLVSEDAAVDARTFRAETGQVLREVGPRIRGLREDPALRELMEDPEVVAAVQAGDHLALMSHPGFRSVVTRAMEREH